VPRQLFVVVDRKGRPVEAAGPAPFDGATREEAAREARATVGGFRSTWKLVLLTPRLARDLRSMAKRWGLESDGAAADRDAAPDRERGGERWRQR
jgi:hypothetical protein